MSRVALARALVCALVLAACEAAAPATKTAPAPSPATTSPTATSAAPATPATSAPATPRPAAVVPLAGAEHRRKGEGADVWLLARGDNAFLGKLEMAPGAQVPEHRDPTEEYIHILEGGGVFTIDGQAHEVGAGTTIYMPADARVSFVNGAAKLVAIQVFAGPGPAAKYDAWAPVPP